LQPGDEVLVPAFTYISTVEVVALLGINPVLVDVTPDTFELDLDSATERLTPKTKAIVPVHLFGQCTNMQAVLDFAKAHELKVIEDTAQAVGATCQMSNGEWQHAGTIGDIGTISFYPSKNLGGYGDGGALVTRNEDLAARMRQIANHGQAERYYFDRVGVNSRLDSLQAAVLDVKLAHLDEYVAARRQVAGRYDTAFAEVNAISTPVKAAYSTHVYHQYTIKVKDGRRDALQAYLQEKGIPSVVFYPLAVHQQRAYAHLATPGALPVSEQLGQEVLSLPIHTELDHDQLDYICEHVVAFFK
ncbi:MAG: DegT/DnrJ/EryC1/StrS family aminotransferase, partial [Bacteroidota bacterium]